MAHRDPAAELAATMIRILEAKRAGGNGEYPLPLNSLGRLADPGASPSLVRRAASQQAFRRATVVAASGHPEAPVALADDVERLADSTLLLDFALRAARTPANQAFSVSQLKSRTVSKLRKPFQQALDRRLAGEAALPDGIGYVTVNRSKRLFLLEDLGGAPGGGNGEDFDAAFTAVDSASGGHNFVSLADLRPRLGWSRERFDATLRECRRAGRYTLSAAEGRHGLTAAEREAGVVEDGALLLYLSRRSS